MFDNCYRDRSVFVTGHTGFKGSWLALWLHKLGAKVTGFSLPSSSDEGHFASLALDVEQFCGDIRDQASLSSALQKAQPEIVFHLAAQSLVGNSYADPLTNWSTNLMGTATLLEVCRKISSIRAIVVVTTDKIYRDQKWSWGYREIDPLGGHDPYSASKAACELLVSSYRSSFFESGSVLLASARAGNVLGGGDWATDRLIPDLMRAVRAGSPLRVRAPYARRPWQHVLDCLRGYLILGQKLLEGDCPSARGWNFGPSPSDCWRVIDILTYLQQEWEQIDWVIEGDTSYHETTSLRLDSSCATAHLGWRPTWSLDVALSKTMQWYATWLTDNEVISEAQLEEYIRETKGAVDGVLQFSH